MIVSFKDKRAKELFEDLKPRGFPSDLICVARRKLLMLDAAAVLQDLRNPPGNHLEALKRERKGQYSIRINDQWRICFRFENGCAFDVEILDYH
ncbi:MAG: hypothetical protein A3G32_06145 [Deltaproteobacteria bacterium RIFCSPLOWO2_12_FULL_40_28]|nr:MAG: hypothetical protein A3C45_02240 [Deltaproteobacteria bacterium RIFCSPHIGHO2_02_FULL_40_28]OGQ19036.1 MAG: hypothetical protein A3E27_05330 [Deltaproteobacteria bacterium RIFCSPHIGHO2_12_FULL_40_32]OGQ40208.1 MAG: hypothetical protein A3I69_00770 [Deltaproteobacteria bacterium RIFCSPLOWO2_02_FULL_40_36]OGQ53479.1 MAG: hypothetical protein A3G32_06145 [Deltaproteobacteria bacterium RIFCSPLOWO2_12_FULL_40_28]